MGLDFVTSDSITFCDIGCGSGAIGISFAIELLAKSINFEGYLSDLSESALEVAKKNSDILLNPIHQNCFTNKIQNSQLKIINSDLFKNYPSKKKFNIIFANLPYIPSDRVPVLANSVKNYEPISALDGGKDGLRIISKLLVESKQRLELNGVVILEVDDSHTDTSKFENEWIIEVRKDQNQNTRFWILKLKNE